MLIGTDTGRQPADAFGGARRRRWMVVAAVLVLVVLGTSLQVAPQVSRLVDRPEPLAGSDGRPAVPPRAEGSALPAGIRVPSWAPPDGTRVGDGRAPERPDPGERATERLPEGFALDDDGTVIPPEPKAGRDGLTTLTAADQRGGGALVVVDTVAAPTEPVVVVVRGDLGGRPGGYLGHRALAEGEHRAVAVELTAPVTASGALWVTLHRDLEPVGTFTFPDGDPPLHGTSAPTTVRIGYEVTR
jgi:hypothetical protein